MSKDNLIPNDKKVLVDIEKLIMYARNTQEHTDSQIDEIAASIKEFKFRNPILVDGDNVIRAGHGRFLAAKKLGMKKVPCIYLTDMSATQLKAYGIVDNQLTKKAEYNKELLALELQDLNADQFNLGLLGFEQDSLFDLMEIPDSNESDKETETDNSDDSDKPEEENETIPDNLPESKLGDIAETDRYKIFCGDSMEILKSISDNSLDSVCCDPPAGIAFMGKDWDKDKGGRDGWIEWLSQMMQQVYRCLKPGAHGLVWAIPRTSHWTATALENSGFETRDIITHLFGSGFPKSHDISKAIDKHLGAPRNKVGKRKDGVGSDSGSGRYQMNNGDSNMQKEIDITEPATEQAKKYDGYGSALKPSSEHWILIRKPLSESSLAANVLKHGTGGLDIDGCRIGFISTKDRKSAIFGTQPNISSKGVKGGNGTFHGYEKGINAKNVEPNNKGRFPSNTVLSHHPECKLIGTKEIKLNGSGECSGNTKKDKSMFNIGSKKMSYAKTKGKETVENWDCHDDCAVRLLDAQSGVSKSTGGQTIKRSGNWNENGTTAKQITKNDPGFGDSGGASRFFYCAKASKSDRDDKNIHPTVKSTALMTYFVKLITPPDGTVLDCFMGSGSTGKAAIRNGFNFVGIEREPEYFSISKYRLDKELEYVKR